MNKLFSVITTIQGPTGSVNQLAAQLRSADAPLLIIGDKKGPADWDLAGTEFMSLQAQLDSPFELARVLPTGHYTRKNVGYLAAISRGADCIYETDDDNAPMDSWSPRSVDTSACVTTQQGWVNVYRCFTEGLIWPRGFPLDGIVSGHKEAPVLAQEAMMVTAPIQQGLANNSPDVDAVWRLVLDAPFNFCDGPSVLLPRGAWCPFNSQSTWWWPAAYPLLYLPSFCSFRMTDIWRSFIAQRCLWEMGHGLVFHAPEVIQERNPHVLMRDFGDEIPGYQRNRDLVCALEGLSLEKGAGKVSANLRTCYGALVAGGFFPEGEIKLVDAWLADLDRCN